MVKLLVFVVALCALQGCLAKPRPDAPAEKIQIEKLVENVEGIAKKIGEQVGITDFDSTKFSQTVGENTNKLLDTIRAAVDNIKSEGKAHEGEINSALTTLQEKLSTTAADLQKAAGPDATKKADEVKVEFKKAYKLAADQYQEFIKTYEPLAKDAGDNVQTISKSFLESLQSIGKSFQDGVNKAVEEHEKTHKH